MRTGKVYLVGAGPGELDLITVKGMECLKLADVVLCDYLANEDLLEFAKKDAEIIHVGKREGKHTLAQDEINRLLVKKAKTGNLVVRLKGGDPFIFGRGGEEAEELVKAGIPFEIVPGVTSAIAVPAYAGIPLTHRDYSSSVAFVTGHEDPRKRESTIDWKRLSTGVGTVVVLMGTRKLSYIVENLIKHGRKAATPAALIRLGTTPGQRTLVAPLKHIPHLAEEEGFSPPAVFVVGDVVKLRKSLNWFETKPLFGKVVVVTRARGQASEFAYSLENLGAHCIQCPTIKITSPDNWKEVDASIAHLKEYDWIIFTSVNGVQYFLERLTAKGRDLRDLKGNKICAIGPATSESLEELGLKLDFVPKEYVAEAVVKGLKRRGISGKKILIPRAKVAREVLPEQLRTLRASVDVVTVYKTVKPRGVGKELKKLFEDKAIDLITFTSSSTVKNFVGLFEKARLKRWLDGVIIACIGPITRDTAEKLGIKVHIMPKEYTIPGLTQAIVNYFESQ
jgi:uroporphyrinogen III methyltransferase/synthase